MSLESNISGLSFDSSIPELDREQIDMLLKIDGDDTAAASAFACELFELFQQVSADALQALDGVCAEGNGEDLQKIVHLVGGSAGNLGLTHLCTFYLAIEQALLDGELTDLTQCAEPIHAAFERACEAFRVEFDVSR